jgi:tape measure domain-containing protein
VADNRVIVEFTGDVEGVTQAGRLTQQELDRISQVVNNLRNPLGRIRQAWIDAFNISGITQKAARDIDEVGNAANRSKGQANSLNQSLKDLAKGASIALLTRQVVQYADTWTRSRNLLAAVGIEAKNLTQTQDELVQIAQSTRTALEPTIFLYSRMLRAVQPLGIAQSEVARAVEITNKAFKAGGAAVSEQNNAILQLSQALGSGILQGDELRSVRENAPLIAQAIADEFDTTIAGLKKLGEQGELTTDRVFKGIIDGGKAIDAQFAVTIPTISDGFTNLTTALIQFTGKTNDASGASLLIGSTLNLVATNLDSIVKLLLIGGVAYGTFTTATLLATASTTSFSLSAVLASTRTAFLTTAIVLTSRSFYTMATAAAVARGALTLLLGPIGLAIAAATGLAILFGVMEDGAEATRNWGVEAAGTRTKLQSLIAAADDLDDDRINRVGTSMTGLGNVTETTAEKVERLRDALQQANMEAFEADLRAADEVIAETNEQLQELERLFLKSQNWWDPSNWIAGAISQERFTEATEKGLARIQEALAFKERAQTQGPEGRDQQAQDRLNKAIMDSYEVREFAARNSAAKELQVLIEKANAAGDIYGNESKEYMSAVKEMETLRDRINREAISSERDKQRKIKDAQKDELEQYDLRMEMEGNNATAVLAIMEEKLAKLKEYYGEDSKEYAQGLQEKIRLEEAFQREKNRVAKDSITTQQEIAVLELDQERTSQENKLALRRQAIDQALALNRINEVQAIQLRATLNSEEIAQEATHQQNLYSIRVAALQSFLALENLRPEERQKALNDLERIEREHQSKMAALSGQAAIQVVKDEDDAAAAVQESWASVVDPIGNSFGQMFRSLYSGTDGWKGSFLKVLDDILFSFVDMGIQMAANWVAQQFAMTTAAVAGSTARTTAVATEAATTTSISAGTALLQILNYAWTAASGAYSAIAGIPIIGPFLAPVLAAGALAAVAGFAGNILSAKGGLGAVPKDGMLAELHKDEMVLPAQFATPLRNMLTSVEGPTSSSGYINYGFLQFLKPQGRKQHEGR